MVRRLVVLAVSVIGLAVGYPAQPEPTIGISVYAASQPDAPLQVQGFQETSKPYLHMKIVVRNVTDKPITAFQLAAAMRTDCSVNPDNPTSYLGLRFEPNGVAPHSTAESKESLVNLAPLVVLAGEKDAKAGYLHVQVGVIEVRFVDGTSWKNKFSDASGLFDPPLLQSDFRRCADWPTPASVLEQFKKRGVTASPSSGSIQMRPNGYFVTCTIKENTASCPTY
jgi:hypothetical protein